MPGRARTAELLISSEVLVGTLQASRALGVSPARSLRAAGLDAALLHQQPRFIPWRACAQLFENLAAEAECPHFALKVLAHDPPVNIGVFNRLLCAAPDLGATLRMTVRHLPVWNDAIRWRIRTDNEVVHFEREELGVDAANLRQIAYMGVGGAAKGIRALVDPSWRPLSVSFTHSPPRVVQPFRDFFGAPVGFGRPYSGFALRVSDLKRPVPTRDDVLFHVLEQHVKSLHRAHPRGDIVVQTQDLIRRHIDSPHCRLADVSRLLSIHPKALQRQLTAHGTSFSALLEEMRYRLATEYLETTRLSLAEVAALVGLSETSALSRGFKVRRGLAPSRWRSAKR
jgi:AraC-like DNA-binding protein